MDRCVLLLFTTLVFEGRTRMPRWLGLHDGQIMAALLLQHQSVLWDLLSFV
jgi:hypothetical protein